MYGPYVDERGVVLWAADQPKIDIFDAIADWCDALHGGLMLQDAFGHLIAGLGAEAGMLVRTHLADFRPIRVAIWDRGGPAGAAPLTTSFADGLFGDSLARPRAASVWLGSAHEGDAHCPPDPALGIWQARRKLDEFAVLVLSGGVTTRDHIELHYRERLPLPAQATLAAVLPTMARTWASRQVGLVTRTVVSHRIRQNPQPSSAAREALLSVANPARLSRAEFRVSLLLSRGLSAAGVASELGVSEATIRSHLRSIYSKTDVSSLAELLFHLLGNHRGPALGDRNSA